LIRFANAPNRSAHKSQEIAALGNILNADNGQYGGEEVEMMRDVMPNGEKNKKDKDDNQKIQAKQQTCRKS
jgi:hypothetical protein